MQLLIKRALDILISSICLIFGLPLLTLVGGVVWLGLGRPILFTQPRSGYRGREYTIYKFRTMTVSELRLNQDGSARVIKDDDRLTSTSRRLREFGLDELPQLWNVLKGDMSLVGPRPYVPMHTAMLSVRDLHRLDMRPGLVCLPEVSGRNSLTWEKRLDLDIHYVKEWNLWLDLEILFRTIPVVLFRRGVYTPVKDSQPAEAVSETMKRN
jgi:lipopolysaccharide/colanic/teichoic acid biosynthesis glycosyltransferase